MHANAFRRSCHRLRRVAFGLAVVIATVLVAVDIIAPVLLARSDAAEPSGVFPSLIADGPAAVYLYALWLLGAVMGEIASGRLFHPNTVNRFRRMGCALILGAILGIIITPNALRAIGHVRGAYLNFDVAALTLAATGACLFFIARIIEDAGAMQAELDEIV